MRSSVIQLIVGTTSLNVQKCTVPTNIQSDSIDQLDAGASYILIFFFFKDIDSSTNFFYPSFFQTFLIYGGRDTRSFLQLFCRQLCRVIFDPFDKDETLTQVANKFLFSKLISPFF